MIGGCLGRLSLPLCDVGVRIGFPVVMLEPSLNCTGVLMNARSGTLVYDAVDINDGATACLYNVTSDSRPNHAQILWHRVSADKSLALPQALLGTRWDSEQ